MKCAVHTEADSAGFCRNCGKAMCGECKREVRGALYCEDCLARLVEQPVAKPEGGNPALAAVLGVVPGLGAVYNGEYLKALLHVVVFGTLITLIDRGNAEAVFIPLFIAFLLYMPFEAYRTAKAKSLGQASTDLLTTMGSQKPVGAYVLIGLGVILLLDNIVPGFDPWRWTGQLWPVLLIVLGVLMLRNRVQPSQTEEIKRND
jgi:hypothetical protein